MCVDLSRRTLLKAGGLTAVAGSLLAGPARALGRPVATVTLTGTAFGTARYDYHPFRVPPGVNRLDVKIVKTGTAKTGLGIFDPRGSHYATLERPNGFRGIYGEERGEFFLSTSDASQSFIPGPVPPGEWTVVVPVFEAQQPVPYVVTVEMSAVPGGQPFRLGADLGVVLDEPGWYRGDLHAHTPESSDAWRSRTALTPRQWADECRRIGLDFLALTDHNVVSQNFSIADDAGDDVLLMAGEEMTNWFHGHATVSGITPGDWFDWRQLPAEKLTPAALRDPRTGTIQEFLRAAKASGTYVSAAHPLGANLSWQFFGEAAADPSARTDGLEVWTGQFQPDDEAALRAWDAMLASGQRVVANGGSDLHGVKNTSGFASGTPTTVVHADALCKRAIVDALQKGRSFITRLPDGVETYLTATGVDGQRQVMGGSIYGAPTDLASFEILVRRAAGMRLLVVRDAAVVQVVPITSDEQVVPFSTPVGAGGYVRVEVRGQVFLDPAVPLAGRTDMEAFTNPVWLVQGPVPPGTTPDDTRPPAQAGPRRSAPPATATAPVTAAATALGVAASLRRRMTLTELHLRTATGGPADDVVVVGQVTAARPGEVVLSRWVPGCCSTDVPVDVVVETDSPLALPGTWWEVEGPAGPGLDDGPPRIAARALRPVDHPPAPREDLDPPA